MISNLELANNFDNIIRFILVWGLIGGTLLSYVPQYYRIYKNKNTIGISEIMLIFGIFSSFFNVLGTIQENLKFLSSCQINNTCYNLYISITQLFSPFLCALIFYCFFLYYNEYDKTFEYRLYQSNKTKRGVKLRAISSLCICILLLMYVIIFSLYSSYYNIDLSGKILNIISTIFSLIMWLPQIYTTYKLRQNHSLSLIALGIHALGCLITVIYQTVFIVQPIWVIMCYIVGFLSETSIILICIYFKRKNKKNREISNLQTSFL